jgi:membrane-bound lytic murein transglycosylase
MIVVLEEDISNKRTTRLQNPNFINANFRVIKWSAHNPENPQQKQLRVTKYAAFIHPGSRQKTSTYNTPIYAINEEVSQEKFYTQYTKQDVLSGIYEPGGKEFGKVKPIAYLTRSGLEAALMQGTVLVNFTDGTKEFLNVDRNNGMSYIRGLKATAQTRYWYFKEVDAIKGYGYKIDAKISIKPGVTFAGDVLNIGFGRIIVIEDNQSGQKRLKMGVIADTGGAFLPNLYQLDFLAGTFTSERAFEQYIQKLPEYTNAYILVKK